MDIETKEVIARAELPKLFRTIRMALGLSQEKMSELSGISRVQISYYETADSVPTMVTFNKWLLATTREIRRLRENNWGRNANKKRMVTKTDGAQNEHGLSPTTASKAPDSQIKGISPSGEGVIDL